MSRTGIMGGTFDPVHLAHLAMAECAREQMMLDKVLFMPSKIPPHKRNRKISSEELRAKLVQLAVEGKPGFYYSDFELNRKEVTYTARTLELLKKQYHEEEFFFIMGADSLFQFENWYLPGKIMEYAVILAVSRDGVLQRDMLDKAAMLSEKYHGEVRIIQMPEMNISSSMIRERLAKGESVEPYLPSRVYEYIMRNHCYRADGGAGKIYG